MREISKAEMFRLYEADMLDQIVNVGDRVLAHNYEGQADNPRGFEVVWCSTT